MTTNFPHYKPPQHEVSTTKNQLTGSNQLIMKAFSTLDAERVNEIGKCCTCEQPLKRFEGVNCIWLKYKARWPFPIVGNILSSQEGYALAFICDECVAEVRYSDKIKFAVEIRDDEIIYHCMEIFNLRKND